MLRLLTALAFVVAGNAASAAAETARADEHALRYYASLGQTARVAAEAKRLSALDPAWRMPDDLYTARPGRADEAPLWDLYAQGKMDAIDRAIRQRQAAEPGWRPSEDLRQKIEVRALRATVMARAKAADWHGVVQSFKENGIAWAKDDPEALWVIAEAYARENDCGEAFVVYRSILTGDADASARVATIEHAIAFIPMASTEKLIALGHTDAAGRSEFEPIALDVTRARISAFLHDEPANAVGAGELARFEEQSRAGADPEQMGLVAWYAFKRHDDAAALEWFKLAIAHGGDAMVAHGLAHTLRRLGMRREAEEVAYAWREPLVNNAILFIDILEEDLTKARPPYIEPNRVQRYAQVTMATESGEGAQALAWYAYDTCQYPLALQWFERAMAWLPKQDTAFGYALALQRAHRNAEFRTVVNRYDGLFPKAVALAFDDGQRHPPPACETHDPSPGETAAQIAPATPVDWTGRTMADTLDASAAIQRRGLAPAAALRRVSVPSPDAIVAGQTDAARLVKKTEFPVAVSPENSLRFSASRTVAREDVGRDATAPLVARRVPGVGAMPYERFGFTLAPGYDGTREASSPTAAERDAPAGTLWALEQSLRHGGNVPESQGTTVDETVRAPVAINAPDGARAGGPRS